MFESLGDRLQGAIDKIRGHGKITEKNIDEAVREIRIALLEADVNYKVVKEFTNNVKEKALGEEVIRSIKPSEQFIKIVHDELKALLGGEKEEIKVTSKTNILMLVGLQGSGKTTTAGKLANFLRKNKNQKPLLVACDVYRPAAIDQLEQISKELNIDFYKEDNNKNPVEIANNAINYAKENKNDYIIIDTAGRLQIDEDLMEELEKIEKSIELDEIFLVLDAMMGQDAINVINGFKDRLNLTGVVLTKMDGDTRGGVALSVRMLTKLPIKFIGVSEKMDGLDSFDPDRMAGRILGMGDIVSLVEKAQEVVNEKEAEDMAKKMLKGKFDLEDFLKQMRTMKKFGSLEKILKLIPGAKKMGLNKIKIDQKEIDKVEAIILSMTPGERRNPDIIKASRKRRIAEGSGQSVQAVNTLLNNFKESKKMMNSIKNGNFKMPF